MERCPTEHYWFTASISNNVSDILENMFVCIPGLTIDEYKEHFNLISVHLGDSGTKTGSWGETCLWKCKYIPHNSNLSCWSFMLFTSMLYDIHQPLLTIQPLGQDLDERWSVQWLLVWKQSSLLLCPLFLVHCFFVKYSRYNL